MDPLPDLPGFGTLVDPGLDLASSARSPTPTTCSATSSSVR